MSSGTARLVTDESEPAEHLFRRLLGAYLGGARIVEVLEPGGLTHGTREIVAEFTRRTVGTGGVMESRDRWTLETGPDEHPRTIPARLTRLARFVLAAHRSAADARSGLPLGGEHCWEEADDAIDREAWQLERSVAATAAHVGLSRTALGVWTVARALERIADQAVTLGEVGSFLGEPPTEGPSDRAVRNLHLQALALLEGALASSDGSRANDLLDVGDALLASARSLSERTLVAVKAGTVSPGWGLAADRALRAISSVIEETQDILVLLLDPAAVPQLGPTAVSRDSLPIPAL